MLGPLLRQFLLVSLAGVVLLKTSLSVCERTLSVGYLRQPRRLSKVSWSQLENPDISVTLTYGIT